MAFYTPIIGGGGGGDLTNDEIIFVQGLEQLTYDENDFLVSISGILSDRTPAQVRTILNVADGANVSKVGTPVDGELGVWTGDGTLGRYTTLTYNNTTGALTIGNLEIDSITGGASYQVDGVDVINKTSIGGTVHQRMTAFAFNDPTIRSASEWMKVGSSTFNTNEGVPMVRPGSITGVSAGFQVLNFVSSGTMAMEVYKNGVSVWTSATTAIAGNGYFVVRDTQAAGLDTFVAGDKIAIRAILTGTFDYDDVMGVLEIEVTD